MTSFSENTSQSFSEECVRSRKPSKNRAPRKVVGDWPDEKVFDLIAMVEERPILWNKAYADHKISRDLIWQKVAAKLADNDWISCRNKWQSLRVTFKTNLSKSKTMGNKIPKVRWKFFNVMRFIISSDDLNFKESSSNLVFTDDSRSNSMINKTLPTPLAEQNQSLTIRMPQLDDDKSPTDFAEQPLQCLNGQDVHAAFGDHIAAELRRLSSKDSLRLKRRLTKTLLDFWDEQEVT